MANAEGMKKTEILFVKIAKVCQTGSGMKNE